jgi:hypothetical protein
MQANTVHIDQGQQLLSELERHYHAFVRAPAKPWLNAEDKAELRQDLERSMKNAQAAIQVMDAQLSGLSPELKGFRDKLVILTTMAETDVKQGSALR